ARLDLKQEEVSRPARGASDSGQGRPGAGAPGWSGNPQRPSLPRAALAEEPAHQAILLGRRRRRGGRGGPRGGGGGRRAAAGAGGGAAADADVLELALEALDLGLQGAAALEALDLVGDLAAQALEFVALPRQVGPLLGHADLHLAHLLHQGLFVLLEL